MNRLYLTFGSRKYLLNLTKNLDYDQLEYISKSGESQFGIFSRELLAENTRPIEFRILEEFSQRSSDAQLIGLYYFSGEDKEAQIAQKNLSLHKAEFSRDGISGGIWMQETKDLHRYVLLLQFADAASFQNFNKSDLLKSVSADFYSNFKVIYRKGFDQD
ncbi:hypothetical protein ACKP2L_03860 [Oenococcus alcoholitolerans]|uniref:hypothetical protein n=1 Tax=Oenococcus alcoholitolerans TaxID=931074 RepID=UPI003F6E7FA2